MVYKNENVFIGNKIKSYRKKKNWSQLELSDRLGIKHNTISAYERGQISIPHAKLVEIAKVLEIKHTDLLPIEETQDTISEYIQEAKSKLDQDQLKFFEQLLQKSLSLNESEREDFFENVRFAVEFFNKKQK